MELEIVMQNWKVIATDPDSRVRTLSRNIFVGYVVVTLILFLTVELRLGLQRDVATAENASPAIGAQARTPDAPAVTPVGLNTTQK